MCWCNALVEHFYNLFVTFLKFGVTGLILFSSVVYDIRLNDCTSADLICSVLLNEIFDCI